MRPLTIWTEKRIDKVKNAIVKGYTASDIANRYSISVCMVYKILRRQIEKKYIRKLKQNGFNKRARQLDRLKWHIDFGDGLILDKTQICNLFGITTYMAHKIFILEGNK